LSLSMGYQKSNSDGTQTGVSYQAGVPAGSSADSLTFDRDTDGSSVQLNLSMPIYSGGILHSQRRQSGHRADSAQQNLIAARRNTVQSARSAHQSVMTNAARVDARQQSIVSAQSALKATQAGYEVGTRNIVDVLVAQQAVYRARRNFANTRYDYILSMMRLKQVAGQLSPDDIYQLNAWLQPELVVQRSVIMGGA
jgi:outer membrane protein